VEIVFWIVINVLVGYAIGKAKDSVAGSIVLSVLLGPIGWIIALLLSGDVRRCPFCAENTRRAATVCKHCGRDLPPLVAARSATPAKSAAPSPPTTPRLRISGAVLSAILVALGIIAVIMWLRTSVVESERAEKTLKNQMNRTDAYLRAVNKVYVTAPPHNPALTAASSPSSTTLPRLSSEIASGSAPASAEYRHNC